MDSWGVRLTWFDCNYIALKISCMQSLKHYVKMYK